MQYRSLGRTGVQVSELCVGCMMFGRRTTEADSKRIIDRAIDEGVNFIDTANIYNDGESERVVGKALAENGKRDRIVLATKVHGTMDSDDPNGRGNHRRHIVDQCHASLQRLQTDHIDLYQIHRPMSDVPIDETLRALDDLITAGNVRYIGTSTFAGWQLMESLMASERFGLNRFVCEQPPYNLLDRRIERELIPFARSYGFALIPWSPLAGGFLTGKYQRGQKPPEDARFSGEGQRGELASETAFDIVDVVRDLAAEKDCSCAQVSRAWVRQQPGVTSPIIGPRTMGQLEDNLGAVDVNLTDEDRQRLDEVAEPERMTIPYYEADFGPHGYPGGGII